MDSWVGSVPLSDRFKSLFDLSFNEVVNDLSLKWTKFEENV